MHSIAALKIYGKFLLGRKFLGTTTRTQIQYTHLVPAPKGKNEENSTRGL